MKKASVFLLILAMLAAPAIFAEEAKSENSAPVRMEAKSNSLFSTMAEKFGRGVSNIFFGAFEFPYRVGKEMETLDPIAAIASGALKGAAWTVARVTVGAFDTATFVIPTKPMIREFDAGWWTA